MEIGFYEENGWVLPKEGTLGNKATNLLENRVAIEDAGLKIPRSLVVPFEYIQEVDDPYNFILEQIDRYFPGWLRIFVRSNSPDEDLNVRFPGLYDSDNLWHQDRGYAPVLIGQVLDSYNRQLVRRKVLGFDEKGMCLLIQDPVCNTSGESDANYSGVFSDIGELALLTFTDPTEGLDAMIKPSVKKYWVDSRGIVQEEHSEEEANLAQRLRRLTDSLPHNSGKGWEIEFVGNEEGAYVVQTTPISKRERIQIANDMETIFDSTVVVGTGEVITEGILYTPYTNSIVDLTRFDATHSNYCLVTVHNNLFSADPNRNVLKRLINPTAILDLRSYFSGHDPYVVHIEQYMREGRVALAGAFNDKSDVALKGKFAQDASDLSQDIFGEIMYSPTRLLVKTDEISGRGIVALADGKVEDFVPIMT